MNQIKVWPHLTIVGLVVALIAGFGTFFWLKHEQTVSAEEMPWAARIQRVDGDVAFADGLSGAVDADANPEWTAATQNQPFSVGDRIYTRENAHTSLAFSGRNYARLNPNTSLDVVSLGNRRTQLALREGSAMFDVGYLDPNEVFEVATPYGAVDFDEPGLYNVGFDNNGGVLVSVLSGLARVVGQGGSTSIGKGEMLTLAAQAASELVLSRLNGDDAGRQVDDYYRYQYGDAYDGRYNDYDAYLSDPYYYDPYRRNVSYQYTNSSIPGLNDLDSYGDWQSLDGYGYAWRPRVDSSWVPYQQGQWTNDYPYGPTWVSSEPWGYAPYHYGRWANVGNQWYWIPEARNTTPAYAPALVAFVPLDDPNQIGWVPLGPGEAYAPRYYDDNWQPSYLTQNQLSPAQLMNLGIPGAVTVVPIDAFGRVINPRSVRRIDQQRLASSRTTLDPLTLTPLRNAVVHSAWGRGKIDLPPGIAKKLRDTPVFIVGDLRDSRFRKGLAKSMRVERVSDRGQKYKVKDNREAKDDRREARQVDQARRQEIDRLNGEAAKGNLDAQRQARHLEQQQKVDSRAQARAQEQATRAQAQATRAQEKANRDATREQGRAQRKAQQQPQGQRVANPARQQSQGAPAAKQPKRESAAPGGGQGRGGEGHGGGKGKGKGKP
ncbi:MAG TPA: DUF6600 domain-containing protein [Pyrinomonadaceae bacterium]|nr:DUF6600 domain-containing protein [Pyrinomonadaceae bacterium]